MVHHQCGARCPAYDVCGVCTCPSTPDESPINRDRRQLQSELRNSYAIKNANGMPTQKVDSALETDQIRSFGLRNEIVDCRLSYAALNALAALDSGCRQ